MPSKKKPTVPIKLEWWFKDIKAVTKLREIVEEPALQQAIAILKEAAGPTVSSIGTDPQENSHKLSWYAGYRDAFNDLEKLTKQPNSGQQPTIDEWNHIQNP
jgi:hypothetical protein|tara:strand:+ start:5285 stop:5590 length:306 start_codon:yes stop_codon:yes gene_type:complete